MKIFNKKQNGFTLVELVVVVAVVGVLAVVATPKIIGVATDAQRASAQGVAGALTAATTRNYATRSANEGAGVAVLQCTDAEKVLEGAILPDGYSIVATAVATTINDDGDKVTPDTTVAAGVKGTCILATDNNTPIYTVFTIVGTVDDA